MAQHKIKLLLAIAFIISCSPGENGKDGSSCVVEPKEKAADGFDIICDGEKVGELANGRDGKGMDCIAEPRGDSLLIICDDEKIGTVYDGKNGRDGRDGEDGASGEQGLIGENCSIADSTDNSAYYKITCGNEGSQTEKTLAKATCGAVAYDPAIMSCEKNILTLSFTDTRDSKKYKAVVIGSQIWMAENLNYNASGSLCYGYAESNCAKYGRLYDWATAMDLDTSYNRKLYTGSEKKKDICPIGWHLPSRDEWLVLINFIGGASRAGVKLKATSGWIDKEYGYYDSITVSGTKYYFHHSSSTNGTDDYGFSALPGGDAYCTPTCGSGGSVNYSVNDASWWTSTENDAYVANYYYIPAGDIYGYSVSKGYNLKSIRCLKDGVSI